jgi:hypothetical protein
MLKDTSPSQSGYNVKGIEGGVVVKEQGKRDLPPAQTHLHQDFSRAILAVGHCKRPLEGLCLQGALGRLAGGSSWAGRLEVCILGMEEEGAAGEEQEGAVGER